MFSSNSSFNVRVYLTVRTSPADSSATFHIIQPVSGSIVVEIFDKSVPST